MIETKLKETIAGYYVEFTIGNQTFKTWAFGKKERAITYQKELKSAFKNLIVLDSNLPNNEETEKWFEDNIGINSDCSASSAIYKFRLWIEQRK